MNFLVDTGEGPGLTWIDLWKNRPVKLKPKVEVVVVWYGIVWYGMVWYRMVWYGIVEFNVPLDTV